MSHIEPQDMPAGPSLLRQVAGVILGGVAGTIVNALMVSIFLPVAAITLMTNPVRHVIAIVLAAALPHLFSRFGGLLGWIGGVAVLAVLATVLAKFIFGAEAAWSVVLAFNMVYALTATLVYRYVAYGRA